MIEAEMGGPCLCVELLVSVAIGPDRLPSILMRGSKAVFQFLVKVHRSKTTQELCLDCFPCGARVFDPVVIELAPSICFAYEVESESPVLCDVCVPFVDAGGKLETTHPRLGILRVPVDIQLSRELWRLLVLSHVSSEI
jgi:hypothetical protein